MIKIVSYGSGNIDAFVNIFKRMNIDVKIAKNSDDLNNSTKIIIPGVGAFDETMDKLNKSGMKDKLHYYAIEKKIPIMGICVGMQIMGDTSEEGSMPGLGWIPGNIQKLPKKCPRLPHMGWNLISIRKKHKLFLNLDEDARFYFLHSYYFSSLDQSNILSETNYNFDFVSSIHNNNIYGIQFHPEKSHRAGCQLLKNFAEL